MPSFDESKGTDEVKGHVRQWQEEAEDHKGPEFQPGRQSLQVHFVFLQGYCFSLRSRYNFPFSKLGCLSTVRSVERRLRKSKMRGFPGKTKRKEERRGRRFFPQLVCLLYMPSIRIPQIARCTICTEALFERRTRHFRRNRRTGWRKILVRECGNFAVCWETFILCEKKNQSLEITKRELCLLLYFSATWSKYTVLCPLPPEHMIHV